MSCRRLTNQRGTTLLESLVALSLFAISAAAIGDLMTRQIRFQTGNATNTTAIALAEREMEDLRAENYSDIATRTSTQAVGALTYTITSTVNDDTPADNMKSIATKVTWSDNAGPQQYTLNAIYTAIKR